EIESGNELEQIGIDRRVFSQGEQKSHRCSSDEEHEQGQAAGDLRIGRRAIDQLRFRIRTAAIAISSLPEISDGASRSHEREEKKGKSQRANIERAEAIL